MHVLGAPQYLYNNCIINSANMLLLYMYCNRYNICLIIIISNIYTIHVYTFITSNEYAFGLFYSMYRNAIFSVSCLFSVLVYASSLSFNFYFLSLLSFTPSIDIGCTIAEIVIMLWPAIVIYLFIYLLWYDNPQVVWWLPFIGSITTYCNINNWYYFIFNYMYCLEETIYYTILLYY